MQKGRILWSLVLMCITLPALTSCGDDHHVNGLALAELEAAVVQEQSKEQADKAALANAIATGASADTIAALQAQVQADEATLLAMNYNVVIWDPRGEFESGGVIQLDSAHSEAQDVTAIIEWLATHH